MTKDELYMSRALQLAVNGVGYTSPNPMVGAVIVCDDKIIGEGYHRQCGEAHAEVNAVNSVRDKSLLKRSTIYVTLEPCSHWGKTPPCSKLIIESGIPNVVVGMTDPYKEVSGRGINMLREAGVDVKVGVLENECVALNKGFLSAQWNKRPYVMLKWAQSADGFIDVLREPGSDIAPVVISDKLNSVYVHKLRAEYDAIMVGTNTAIKDNPKLNVRRWDGKNPVRVLVDRNLRCPKDLNLFDNSVKSIVFTEKDAESGANTEYVKISFDDNMIQTVLSELHKRSVQSLIVEGGADLLTSFIKSGVWDEARVEVSETKLSEGVKAPKMPEMIHNSIKIGKSLVISYENI